MFQKIGFLLIGAVFGFALNGIIQVNKMDQSIAFEGNAESSAFANKKRVFAQGPVSVLVAEDFPSVKSVSLFYKESDSSNEKTDFIVATIDQDDSDDRWEVSIDLPNHSLSYFQKGLRREFILIDSEANVYRDLDINGSWDVMTKNRGKEVFLLSNPDRIKVNSLPQYSNGKYTVVRSDGTSMIFQRGNWDQNEDYRPEEGSNVENRITH